MDKRTGKMAGRDNLNTFTGIICHYEVGFLVRYFGNRNFQSQRRFLDQSEKEIIVQEGDWQNKY